MRDVIHIHGGETFDSIEIFYNYLRTAEVDPDSLPEKRWRDNLADELGGELAGTRFLGHFICAEGSFGIL